MEEFELPAIHDDEILAKVISDSICMSTYKAVQQGINHKRIPADVAEKPTIIGHEFSGELVEIGSNWKHKFTPGQKFSIQPALYFNDGPVGVMSAPGIPTPLLEVMQHILSFPGMFWYRIVCCLMMVRASTPHHWQNHFHA